MVIELATQLETHQRRLERVQHILEQLLRWRYLDPAHSDAWRGVSTPG
jgi:hypothetical protein